MAEVWEHKFLAAGSLHDIKTEVNQGINRESALAEMFTRGSGYVCVVPHCYHISQKVSCDRPLQPKQTCPTNPTLMWCPSVMHHYLELSSFFIYKLTTCFPPPRSMPCTMRPLLPALLPAVNPVLGSVLDSYHTQQTSDGQTDDLHWLLKSTLVSRIWRFQISNTCREAFGKNCGILT